jgi:4-hydroxyphenylpyruvate dioxygenase
MTADTAGPRSHARRTQPAGPGRHRVHRIHHLAPAGAGPGAGAMGFRPVARHRSREVLLYRQGVMNVVINAHPGDRLPRPRTDRDAGDRRRGAARARCRRRLSRVRRPGRLAVPVQVQPMELNIPAIHGVGASRLYFVDRWREFSIYDVDFVPIPTVDHPPALAGHALVRHRAVHRPGPQADWTAFYRELFGFTVLPDEQRFGILPKAATCCASPCGTLHVQLIEPDRRSTDRLQRGTCSAWPSARPTCRPRCGAARARRGLRRIARAAQRQDRGALTQDQPWRRDVRAGPPRHLRSAMNFCSPRHRRLRHGHHHAGRARWRPSCAPCARPASAR